MSKQRNYPEGLAEAVAAIPFDQMQDFARKIMQPTTPEPARCVCGGPEGDCGCALGYADAVAEQRKKEPAPLLTNLQAFNIRIEMESIANWYFTDPELQALHKIETGRVACYDTQTHVAVTKMTEEQAREKFEAWANEANMHRQDRSFGRYCYLAALRDAGVLP